MQPCKILVVDDTAAMRSLYATFLSMLGYAVPVEADCVDCAWDVLSQHTDIDLIFLDLRMPGPNGIEFLTALRAGRMPLYQNTPVIVVSGYSDKHSITKVIAAGANSFLAKPVSLKVLLRHIDVVMRRR